MANDENFHQPSKCLAILRKESAPSKPLSGVSTPNDPGIRNDGQQKARCEQGQQYQEQKNGQKRLLEWSIQ